MKVKTIRQAAEFLEEKGLATLFPQRNASLPSLFQAVTGLPERVSWADWDASWDRLWEWKDELPEKKLAWYGHFFSGKPTFISAALLPHVLALKTHSSLDQAYEQGALPQDAKKAAEALERAGSVSTRELRESLGWYGKEGNRRFHRTMLRLQQGLWVAKAGTEPQRTGWDAEVVDLMGRHFKTEVGKAKKISRVNAWNTILATTDVPASTLVRLFRTVGIFIPNS